MSENDAPMLSDFEVSMLLIERDVCQYKKERIDELISKIGEAKGFTNAEKEAKKEPAAVKEETFAILKFEPQTGAKIGEYEVAYKANNLEDKWTHAHNVLRNSNATIQNRYHGEGYEFAYWLYGEGKIYRQKLKPKP
jgi:hypothetical protein